MVLLNWAPRSSLATTDIVQIMFIVTRCCQKRLDLFPASKVVFLFIEYQVLDHKFHCSCWEFTKETYCRGLCFLFILVDSPFTGVSDFINRPDFNNYKKKNKHDVSETVSVLRLGETPILLGPLERANLNHCPLSTGQ
jgi:hypothetical protein